MWFIIYHVDHVVYTYLCVFGSLNADEYLTMFESHQNSRIYLCHLFLIAGQSLLPCTYITGKHKDFRC